MEEWKNAPSMSYYHEMVNPQHPDDIWASDEIIEQGRRRVYQEWPLDSAIVGFDGKKVWTKDWKRLNPPTMMANVSYFFINLPWITQDKSVLLGKVREGKLPQSGITKNEYYIIKMTYKDGNPYEYYDLYIDKETFLLGAVNYTVTYGALLDIMKFPSETKFAGPLLKIYDKHLDVDGLKLPQLYTTYNLKGQKYGIHTVKNILISRPFDEKKVLMPVDAIVDKSGKDRRAK